MADAARYRFQYAAKILCTSNIPGTSQTTSSVLPGTYATAVNVHNPSDKTARVREKVALGPEQVSTFTEDVLEPDAMMRLDCGTIVERFGPFVHGVEGFLVIESTHSLDVTAVYTAGPVGGAVASIDVERVAERKL